MQEKSIELSKKDEMWQDAMQTAAESKNQDLSACRALLCALRCALCSALHCACARPHPPFGCAAESLVYFFVDRGLKECFSACLFTCYELIRADVVMEVAWRFQLNDFAMPFLVQTMREYDDRVRPLARSLSLFRTRSHF